MSIQIRTLKLVQANEARRAKEQAALIESLNLGLRLSQPQLTIPEPLPSSPVGDATQIRAILRDIHQQQNERDLTHDIADLRQLMRTALQTNSDAEMIEVLQVGRDEMPEAIKTLQRALEREVEREMLGESEASVTQVLPVGESPYRSRGRMPGRSRAATVSAAADGGVRVFGAMVSTDSDSGSSETSARSRDTLDREFMESGIDAMRRLSQGQEVSLPSWTITRYEIDLEEKIGIGFFSDVYKGKWREHTVAIKALAETTPRKLFVHEIGIWKTLTHPNVLELLGASSATGDPPYFLVSPYYSNGSLVKYLKGLSNTTPVDFLKMIHEVAKGMEYLHEQGVLHGDLKAGS